MKPSELLWEKLGDCNRGKAQEAFAEILVKFLDQNSDNSNGIVLDALELSLDALCPLDKLKQILKEKEI